MRLLPTYYYFTDTTVPLNAWFSDGIREYGLYQGKLITNAGQSEHEDNLRTKMLKGYNR